MTADELFQGITKAVEGLKFYSESQSGAQAWRPGRSWNDLRIGAAEFAEIIGLDEAAGPFEWSYVGGFSGFMGHRCDDDSNFFDQARIENAHRMTALVQLMENNLEQLKVFRSGEATITCIAFGRHESGELLGFTTTLVET